jgi:hypothetical protein
LDGSAGQRLGRSSFAGHQSPNGRPGLGRVVQGPTSSAPLKKIVETGIAEIEAAGPVLKTSRIRNRKRYQVATYVLIDGAGDVAWYWHLLQADRESGATTWRTGPTWG